MRVAVLLATASIPYLTNVKNTGFYHFLKALKNQLNRTMNQNDLNVEKMNMRQIEAALLERVDPSIRDTLQEIITGRIIGVERELGQAFRSWLEQLQHPDAKHFEDQTLDWLTCALDSASYFYRNAIFDLRKRWAEIYRPSEVKDEEDKDKKSSFDQRYQSPNIQTLLY